MQFSIEGVSVFIPFIRVDHEGEEWMCPKQLGACSLPFFTRGSDFDCNLNAITNTAVGTAVAVGAADM